MHNILYTEEILSKMGLLNGKCFFCISNIESKKHLFYECKHVKPLLEVVQNIMLKIPVVNPIKFDVCTGMLFYCDSLENPKMFEDVLTPWFIYTSGQYGKQETAPSMKIKILLLKYSWKNSRKKWN